MCSLSDLLGSIIGSCVELDKDKYRGDAWLWVEGGDTDWWMAMFESLWAGDSSVDVTPISLESCVDCKELCSRWSIKSSEYKSKEEKVVTEDVAKGNIFSWKIPSLEMYILFVSRLGTFCNP